MKINGRYGRFTVRPDQQPFYAKRAKRDADQRRQAQAQEAEWLERHKTCANGCGQPVAFYDKIHYALRYSGCCSAECEAEHRAKEAAETERRFREDDCPRCGYPYAAERPQPVTPRERPRHWCGACGTAFYAPDE